MLQLVIELPCCYTIFKAKSCKWGKFSYLAVLYSMNKVNSLPCTC